MISFGRRFAMFVVVLGLMSRVAQAGVVITIQQNSAGTQVNVTGSGSLNLAALTAGSPFTQPPDIIPFDAEAVVGTTAGGSVTDYFGTTFSGPTSFGGGIEASPISGSGAIFGIQGSSADIVVPTGYVSGTALGTSTNTYSGSLSSLGLTLGTYKWTWGNGATADSLTVNILTSTAVPEPSTAVLAAFDAVTLCAYRWCRHRRHQRRQAAA
jgi:hypothetical protein